MHRDCGSLSGSHYRTRYDVGALRPDRVRDAIRLADAADTVSIVGTAPLDPSLGSEGLGP